MKTHLSVGQRQQACIGNRYAVRIAAQIAEDALGTGERRISILPIVTTMELSSVTPIIRWLANEPASAELRTLLGLLIIGL